jgi:hypothetical protein
MKIVKVKLELRKKFSANKCRLQKCNKVPRARGICEVHAQTLRASGKYEKFALPPRMNNKYKVNKKKKNKNLCIIDDCKNDFRSRGICNKHYYQLMRRDIYEKYALKAV